MPPFQDLEVDPLADLLVHLTKEPLGPFSTALRDGEVHGDQFDVI